jgi:predicted dehydrogenase
VFAEGGTLQLDNFLRLRGYNWPGFRNERKLRQDKGRNVCAQAFLDAVQNGGPAPIPSNELFEVARVTIEVAETLRSQV